MSANTCNWNSREIKTRNTNLGVNNKKVIVEVMGNNEDLQGKILKK